LVLDQFGVGILFEFNHDTNAFPIAFIPQITNAHDFLIFDQVGNLFNELGLVDLVGDFCNNNAFFPFFLFLIAGCPQGNDAFSGRICLTDASRANNFGSGRKIRTFNEVE
jgi:hypothetical protein